MLYQFLQALPAGKMRRAQGLKCPAGQPIAPWFQQRRTHQTGPMRRSGGRFNTRQGLSATTSICQPREANTNGQRQSDELTRRVRRWNWFVGRWWRSGIGPGGQSDEDSYTTAKSAGNASRSFREEQTARRIRAVRILRKRTKSC